MPSGVFRGFSAFVKTKGSRKGAKKFHFGENRKRKIRLEEKKNLKLYFLTSNILNNTAKNNIVRARWPRGSILNMLAKRKPYKCEPCFYSSK